MPTTGLFQRRGGSSTEAPPIRAAAGVGLPDHDTVAAREQKGQRNNSSGIKALRYCFKAAAVSAGVNVVSYCWILYRNRVDQYPIKVKVLELLTVLWKINLCAAIRGFLLNDAEADGNADRNIKNYFESMVDTHHKFFARMWGQTFWIVVLESLAEISCIFRYRRVGWLHPAAFLVALAVGVKVVADTSATGTAKLFANNAIVGKSVRRKIDTMARNMALCSSALLCLEGVVVVALKTLDKSTWFDKLYQLTDAYSPIVVATLLWKLRRSLLASYRRAAESAPERATDGDGKWASLDESVTKFFNQAGGVFKSEVVLTGLATFGPFVQRFVLKSVPWLAKDAAVLY